MNILLNELEEILIDFHHKFINLDQKYANVNLSEDKWSLNQIIGHLIDSASNNHQRFIRLQLENQINFPDYNKNEWLNIQNHNDCNFKDLLLLFIYFNKLIINIIKNIDRETLLNKWMIKWKLEKDYITLEELLLHYLKHIKSHFSHFEKRLEEIKKMKYTDK